MIFPAGQTFSFSGSTAQGRAQEVLREFGEEGVVIEESRPGFAKVRILREAVFEAARRVAPINRGALPVTNGTSVVDRSSPFRAVLVVLAISFLNFGGVYAAESVRVESAPAVVGAAGARPTVWLNGARFDVASRGGEAAARGLTSNFQRSTSNVQRVGLASLTTGSQGGDALATFAAGVLAFAALQKGWHSLIGKKADPEERLITPSPLIVTPAKEWATQSEVAELKQEVHRQMVDVRAYVHTGMHDLAGKIQGLSLQNQDREERLSEKLDVHWKTLSNERIALYDRIDDTRSEIGKLVDTKVGETHVRINELTKSVGELVGELRASRTGGRAK